MYFPKIFRTFALLTSIVLCVTILTALLGWNQTGNTDEDNAIVRNDVTVSSEGNSTDCCIPMTSFVFPPAEYNLAEVKRSRINPDTWKHAKPSMTDDDREIFAELLASFHKVCTAHNFTYFLISGSLLGSYRHHGFMPWDDDVDILMPEKDRLKIYATFQTVSNLTADLRVLDVNTRMKVFHRTKGVPVPLPNFDYCWPFIDITFYNENNTHLWQFTDHLPLPKSLVFPLHLRPFETVLLFSPMDTYAVLKLIYPFPGCMTAEYSHKLEQFKASAPLKFDCKEVSRIYPFVHRRESEHGVEETLMVFTKRIYTVVVDEPLYAITLPYVFELV